MDRIGSASERLMVAVKPPSAGRLKRRDRFKKKVIYSHFWARFCLFIGIMQILIIRKNAPLWQRDDPLFSFARTKGQKSNNIWVYERNKAWIAPPKLGDAAGPLVL